MSSGTPASPIGAAFLVPKAARYSNPLNEVEVLSESRIDGGVLRTDKVVRYVPEQQVGEAQPSDPVRLDRDRFQRHADAFFAEVERRLSRAA